MQSQAAALAQVVSVFQLESVQEPADAQLEPQAASTPAAAVDRNTTTEQRVVALRRPEPFPRLAAANEWHEY